MPKKYRSPARAVRVAAANHELLELALRTRCDREQLITLSEALDKVSDPGALVEKLPPVAIEPFVMAAWPRSHPSSCAACLKCSPTWLTRTRLFVSSR